MNTTFWNCQGLGNDPTVRRLKEIQRKYLPDIICLSETKQDDDYLRDTATLLGYEKMFTVPPVGLSGGLALLWKESLYIDVLFSNANIVDCFMKINGIGFYYTLLYGHPNRSLRNITWEKLERLGLNRRDQPWLVGGDFNEILSNDEKKGGRDRTEASFADFRRTIRSCQLQDLTSIGDKFSWAGTRGNHHVLCCLDRVMINQEWLNQFPNSLNNYLEFEESDHRPMVVQINSEDEARRGMFIYDGRLISSPGFKETVKKSWNQNNNLYISDRLQNCRRHISIWKKKNRSNAKEQIAFLKKEIDNAVSSGSLNQQRFQDIRTELHKAYTEEELFWKQKSRSRWLKEGDRNTSYFHQSTVQKRTKQRMRAMIDSSGVIRYGTQNISKIAISYFQTQYISQGLNQQSMAQAFQGFNSRVTTAMNDDLIRTVSRDEIDNAIFEIGPTRAPGPDGFTAAFYQNHWSDIKEAVIEEVTDFFTNDKFDRIQNHTNICLIPKTTGASNMTDYRPIALCNVSYKIISKILINKMKRHLSDIISPHQAAFVPGRIISDNTIIAQEMFHSLRSKKRQAKSYMAIKTDITKAYDRLEWGFLEETLKHMGFHHRWIKWIMTCVSSVTYSVLINGTPHGYIQPSRGIRQGDPLSPYLFIICAEVLSHLMNQAEYSRKITPMKLGNHGVGVSHLLFADDSLFFTLANEQCSKTLQDVFTLYENVSGQSINLRKSSITFGKKVSATTKTQIRRLMGIHNEGGGKYLGLPEEFQRRKADTFQYVLDRVKEKTQGWSKRFLSPGEKEVLLKAVASALPVYCMNIFKLPKGFIDDLNKVMADYWWSKGYNQNGMHWVSWKRLCTSKKNGGLGFRDFEAFNQALLAKQAWRIFQHPECLLARVIKGKYFHDSNILITKPPKSCSYVWRSILHGRDLLIRGLRFVIGNGEMVQTWLDPWLPSNPPRPARPIAEHPNDIKVATLIDTNTGRWNNELVRQHIHIDDVQTVLSIKLCATAREDMLGWHYTNSGQYTVKSGYWLASELSSTQQVQPLAGSKELKHKLWNIKTASKINHFLWKAVSGILPTGQTLHHRHITTNPACLRCCDLMESIDHILFTCPYAIKVWRGSNINLEIFESPTASFENKIQAILDTFNFDNRDSMSHLPLWILWRLWKSRNILVHQRKNIEWYTALKQARDDSFEWVTESTHGEALNNTGSRDHYIRHEVKSTWRRPKPPFVKCNYDGAWKQGLNGQAGWIVRDAENKFLLAGRSKGMVLQSPLEAEFQALVMAMESCYRAGYQHVQFEGDNINIPALLTGSKSNIHVFNWIREGRMKSNHFVDCQFLWTNRDNNRLADKLARMPFTTESNDSMIYTQLPYMFVNDFGREYFD